VVSFTPLPLYPRAKSPRYALEKTLVGPQSWSKRRGEEKIRLLYVVFYTNYKWRVLYFGNVTPCSPVELNRRSEEMFCPYLMGGRQPAGCNAAFNSPTCLQLHLRVNPEDRRARSSHVSVNLYQTTRCHITEDSALSL
jgi:hypothetical protein